MRSARCVLTSAVAVVTAVSWARASPMTYEQKLAAKLPEIKQALQEIVEAKQKQWSVSI